MNGIMHCLPMFVIVIVTFVSWVLFAKQVGSEFQSKLKETFHISGSLKNSFRYFTTFLYLPPLEAKSGISYLKKDLKENDLEYIFDAKF